MIILLLLALVIGILLGLIVYARWNYGKLEKLGFTVVKPHFLLGTTHDIHKHVIHTRDYEWFKKYGAVFGIYEGREPQVFVCDPELIRQIFVKDFEYFRDRREIELGDPIMNEALDFLPYDKWKAVRSAITPMFSTSRVKKMSVIMSEAVDDYIVSLTEDVQKASGGKLEKFNIYQETFNMSCDLIARCVFSIKADNRKDPNNFLTKTLSAFFSEASSEGPTLLNSMAYSFPILKRFVPIFNPSSSVAFVKLFGEVIAERKKSGERKDDLVNQLVGLVDRLDTPEFKKINVTLETIMAQTVNFFIAGPDQYATTMTFMAYYLAHNPECEKLVHEELDAFMKKHEGKICHDNLSELVYTNACIQETLRMASPFFRPERICTRDWEHNGIKITKGIQIIIPVYAANRNPEAFDDPESFVPARWLGDGKSSNPYAFSTFGHGPRNCTAIRFNYEVLPMMAANIFSRFQIKLRPDTTVNYKKGSMFFIFYDPIYFDLVQRVR